MLYKPFLIFFSLFAFFTSSTKKNITEDINKILKDNSFNGSILVCHEQNIIFSKNIGFSDFENQKKIQSNSQYVIGSISKQITAVLILKAYEENKLLLNDSIGKHLPFLKQDWKNKISIHHLLTHTHGIVDIESNLEFNPGDKFNYSQLGYHLLAQILENIYQKKFSEICTSFFKKIGLKNTFHPENRLYKNLSKGYTEDQNKKLVFTNNSLDNYPAAGSIISTISDLQKWNQLLYNEKLITKKSLALMKTAYATRLHPIFESVEYGYGILFLKGEENIQIGALGYAPGFVSANFYYPKSKYHVIILQNTATNLDNFKETFKVHLKIMDLVKQLNTST